MDVSGVKLIVTDMDGTLLNSKHEVSALFFEQFEQLKKRNIQFVAASGRQYHSIAHKLASIKKDIIIVAENGAYVKQDNKELYVNSFEKNEVLNLVNTVQQIPEVTMVLAGKKKAYFLNGNKELEILVSEYYSEYELVSNFDTLPDDEILKLALYNEKGSEQYIYPFVKHFESDYQVKISGECWVDIALKTNHKGNAVARIQQQLEISEAETMAFGDYQNDIEMLQKAKFSYAMENAHFDVKKIAKYTTTTNDVFGVENVLKQVLG